MGPWNEDEPAATQVSVRIAMHTLAELTVDSKGLSVARWDDDGYGRDNKKTWLDPGLPAVYIWFVTAPDPFEPDARRVIAAYVGQTHNLKTRFAQYEHVFSRNRSQIQKLKSGKRRSTERNVRAGLLAAHDSGHDRRIWFAWVNEATIGKRSWDSRAPYDRLLLEAAILADGVAVRGHKMINRSAIHRAGSQVR